MGDVTREEIQAIVTAGLNRRLTGIALEEHVRHQLLEQHPDLPSITVVRNGHRYAALDYLMLDLDTYGPQPE